jgi:phage repressor protein C with HTH and peptisase S24 domain
MNSVVTQRFIDCIEHLKTENRIKSARQFAISLNYLPQGLSEIYKGRRDVTIELLRKAVERYHLNPQYLFNGKGNLVEETDSQNGFRILTLVTDADNNERIIHVPIPAQAGYATQSMDPVFIKDLPTYSLPDYSFRTGTYRSFDIAGDSMEPSLYKGDKVVCSFIEPNYWADALKDRQMHVVVSHGDIVIKRIINRIKADGILELCSDNIAYKPFNVPVNDIREIWKVRLRISSHLDPPELKNGLNSQLMNLETQIQLQQEMIEGLNQTLKQLRT